MDLVSVPFEAGAGINLEVHTMKAGFNCNLFRKYFLRYYCRTEGIRAFWASPVRPDSLWAQDLSQLEETSGVSQSLSATRSLAREMCGVVDQDGPD